MTGIAGTYTQGHLSNMYKLKPLTRKYKQKRKLRLERRALTTQAIKTRAEVLDILCPPTVEPRHGWFTNMSPTTGRVTIKRPPNIQQIKSSNGFDFSTLKTGVAKTVDFSGA